MTRDEFDRICSGFPGATWADPADGKIGSWKVCDKMFACVGSGHMGICVKCADTDTARMLIDAAVASKAPYFHASWVQLDWDADPDEIAHRISVSYDLIVSKLTKKQRATLS